MRLFRRSFLILIGCVFAWASAGAQTPASSMVKGVIKASAVRGTVKKVNLDDKSEAPLTNGESLYENNAVVTGGGESSVVLVFANGSTVRVGRDSRLEIREFMMDPLKDDIPNVAALTKEPTKSRTNLRLEFGEMVGNVKTLDRAAGSSFSVSTPAGAAGIRGTIFRIVYRPAGTGQAFFNYQLSTSEGVVLFEGVTSAGAAAVQVPLGQEMQVIAQVDPATNSIVVRPPTGAAGAALNAVPISNEAATALQTATVQIVQAQQQTTFSQVQLQGPTGAPPQNPPAPPSNAPRTTPGDGRE